MKIRTCTRVSRLHTLLVLCLCAQLLVPPSAWALAADGSTLAGDRGVQPDTGALAAALPADLFSGAATHRIPIELPPGTGGMSPALTLAYSTAGPLDSWVGSRWSLALPSISRSLERGTPSYNDSIDVFTLEGQELVPENASPSLPRRYHTRRESFLRITHEVNGSWSVERKDGIVMRFGLSSNARLTNASAQTFQWLLSEQEDPRGNAITAVYDRADLGSAYPAEIRYTLRRAGSSLQSLDNDPSRDRVVSFAFEPRPDPRVSFASGFEQRIDRRLDRIDVRVGAQLVRRYELAYVVSPDSFRSLVSQVALFGSDADSASPTPPLVTSFSYHSNETAGSTGWEQVTWPWPSNLPIVQGNQKDNGVRLGDVDGDGLVDLIKAYATVDLTAKTAVVSSDSGVYLNTGAGFSTTQSPQWPLPAYSGAESILAPFFAATINGEIWGTGKLPVDLTGDGRVDLAGGLLVLHPNFGDFLNDSGTSVARLFHWPWFQSSASGWLESPIQYAPGDPFISFADGSFATAYLGLQSGANDYMTIGGNTRFADLTGDGLPEMVVRGTSSTYKATATGFACYLAGATSYVIYNEGDLVFRQAPLAFTTMLFPPPAAGAGVPACIGSSQALIHSPNDFAPCNPSTGGTACIQTLFHNHGYALGSDPLGPYWWDSQLELGNTPIDLNADGLADVLSAYTRGSAIRSTRLNNGARGFVLAPTWNLPTAADLYTIASGALFSRDEGVRLADVNGDGRVDIVKAKGGAPVTTWLNNGGPSPWVDSPAWESPIDFVNSSGKDRGVRLLDVDGDGMVDVVRGEGSNQTVYLNRGEIPDLLTAVTSPLGAQTSFGYTPSTQFDNTGGDAPDLPQVLPLVTSISINDANGTNETTTLDYEGGVFDANDRELRGFRRVTATRAADGRSTTTLHHQDVARAGLVESVEIRNGQGVMFARSENTYAPDADGLAPYTPLLASTSRLEFDGQSTPRRSLVSYVYDGGGPLTLGNLTALIEYGEVSAGGADIDPLDTRTTEFDYALPSDPSQAVPYLVDRVAARRVRAGSAPGSGTVLRESRLFYDGDVAGGAPPTRGDLTQRVDVLGEPGVPNPTTQYDYDTYGNLVRVTSPRAIAGEFGGSAEIEYDALYHSFPVAMVNELGQRAELSYATPAGCSLAHTPAAGLVHEVRDPNVLAAGKSTLRCYDAFGRLVRERAPDGLAESTFAYVDTPGAARMTRSDLATTTGGVRTSTVFLDGLGRAVRSSSQGPQGQLVEATAQFDAAGRIASETAPRFATSSDPLQTTQYVYDVLDRLVQTTLPGVGRIHRLAYDRGLITATDANLNVTRTRLDTFGRVTTVEESGLPGSPLTHYEYNELGELVRLVDSGSNETLVAYDALGRKTRLVDPDTGESLYGYDGNGNLTLESNALGAVAWFYDALERPTQRLPSSGQRSTWAYDTAQNGIGRLAEQSRSPIKHLPIASDLLGRPTRERFVTTSGGPAHVIETSFDPLGQVASRSYPNGIVALWQRDARGFLTGVATGTGETYADQIEWDARGQLAKWRTGALASTTRRFEPATGRLSEIEIKPATGASFEFLRYGYDSGDRITSVTDLVNSARNRSFGFDARDRLVSATGPYGTNAASQALYYRYDPLGNLQCLDGVHPTLCVGAAAGFVYPTPGPGVARPHAPSSASLGTPAYDGAGNLTALGSRGYEYDVFGQLVRVRDGGALKAELFYDATGDLARVIDAVTGQTRYRVAPDFEWNAGTNRAQIRIALAGNEIAVHDTAYDPNAPVGCSGTPALVAGRGDPVGFVVLFAPGFVALLGFTLLQAQRRRAEARLALVPAGLVISSPPRWQVGLAATTGVVFIAVVSIPVPLFGPGSGTASAVSPASVTYYHGDHLGSSVVMTNDVSGSPLVRHLIYRPYGSVVVESSGGSSVPPEVGFTGQRFEKPAALYDYGARWYDPEMGRFLQPDSIVPEPFNPQSLNRYSYVMNDPVNRIDPTGQLSFSFTGATAYSGTIFGTHFGSDVFIGSGTHYSTNGGGSSLRPTSGPASDLPPQQHPSRITAEPFMFAQTIPVQHRGTAPREAPSPFDRAIGSVLRNDNIPDEILDRLEIGNLIRVAKRRVEVAEQRVPPGDDASLEALEAFDMRRKLGFAGKSLALALGVTTIDNALLALDVAFPGKTVGEVIRTGGEILLDSAVPGPADFSPGIVRNSVITIRGIAQSRVPF